MESLITVIPPRTCGNCEHFDPMSDHYGKCLNPKNKVKAGPLNLVNYYVTNRTEAKEFRDAIEDGTRYPDTFGCIFFEPENVSGA